MLDVLASRGSVDTRLNDLTVSELEQVEGFKDHFTKDELVNFVQKQKVEEESRLVARSAFRRDFEAKKEGVLAKKKSAGARGGAGRKPVGSSSSADPLKALRVLAMVPPGAITQKEASKMMPPKAYIWNNWRDGAWCAHFAPHPRFSAPWPVHGHRGAALFCIRQAWRLYLESLGRPLSDCPVRGLFDDEA